ncbi:MAG: trypsin-like peptidase domain-containing protein [Phaeospirillum sp.]|nr:trypsin-like peptidase domain-containing protein [Phaeospirillum sp.]
MFVTRTTIGLAVGILALSGIAFAAPETKPIPSMELARSLIDAEQFEQAVAVLKQLDTPDSTATAQINLLFGRIYLAIGKPAKALGFFEEASFASLDGEAEAYLGLAEADLALGDLAKARRNAALALKSDPDLIAAHLVLARADQRIGKAAEATNRLRQLQRDRENTEDVAIVLARFLAQQDGPSAGIAELERFVRQVPTSAGAYDALGQMKWATGRKAEAVQARDTARQLYLDRGQTGRSEAMAAWIKAVDPQGKLKTQETMVEEPAKPIQPELQKPIPPKEAPPPKAQPRSPVEAAPAPPPRRVTQAVALAQPEPFPIAPGSPIMTGSGVVLEGGRQIITNRHVVEGTTTLYVRNGTGYVRKARVAKVSQDDDLALLEIDKAFPEGAVTPISEIVQPTAGRAAIVMGYPLIGILGDEQPALTEGIVAKAAGLGNDPNTFQMTTKINKGNSGGPVFDKRGHLLGVAVGKTDNAAIYQKTGTQMEDMNIGIKGGRILAFLGKVAAAETAAPEMSLEDLYQQMLPRAVLIVGQK